MPSFFSMAAKHAILIFWLFGVMAGCAYISEPASSGQEKMQLTLVGPQEKVIPSRAIWGGDIFCDDGDCRLVTVEHSDNNVVIYKIQGKKITRVAEAKVGYHPDDAIWLGTNWVAAAVEGTNSIDLFMYEDSHLRLAGQVRLDFAPRSVRAWRAGDGKWRMLALPYSGRNVALFEWSPREGQGPVHYQTWCNTPWSVVSHKVDFVTPDKNRLVVACWEDAKVIETTSVGSFNEFAGDRDIRVLRQFEYRVRQVGVAASGSHVFATVDLGTSGWVYDSGRDEWTTRWHGLNGAIAVAPHDAHTVAWANADGRIRIVRYDDKGAVVAFKELKSGGSPERLIWIDIDGNGGADLVVLNGSYHDSEIFYDVSLP